MGTLFEGIYTYIYDGLLIFFFFLEWEMFQTKVVEKMKTHYAQQLFFQKWCHLWDNVEKYGAARQATHDNVVLCRKDLLYMQGKDTDKHSLLKKSEWIFFCFKCSIRMYKRAN